MAELIIRIDQGPARPHPAFQDGDIMHALNDRRILQVHAEHICWPRINDEKVGGFLTDQPLLENFLAHIYLWKNIRTGMTHAKKIATRDDSSSGILKGQEFDISKTMDVQRYVFGRLVAGKKPMFGKLGREIWYGGRSDLSASCINNIWDDIESDTGKMKADHVRVSDNTTLFKKLCIPVDDFTNEERVLYEEQDIDSDGEVIRIRKRNIDWKNMDRISGGTIKKIKDPSIPIDMGKFDNWNRSTIVKVKT